MKNLFRRFGRTALAAAACLAVGTSSYAAIWYADANNIFVGKGDVQIACGWNNADANTNLPLLSPESFSVSSTVYYDAVCTFVTGEGTRGENTHNVPHTTDTSISKVSSVYDTRKNNLGKITGLWLTLGETVSSGDIPVVGGPCYGNEGHDGTWSSVTLNTELSDVGEYLYVDCTGGSDPSTLVGPVLSSQP